jgi:hypothetical protein
MKTFSESANSIKVQIFPGNGPSVQNIVLGAGYCPLGRAVARL